MLRRLLVLTRPLLLPITALVLFGCGPFFQTSRTSQVPPTPVVERVKSGTETPVVFTDLAAFQDALLQALSARDAKLQLWMTDPLITGTWRGNLINTSPADAVKKLFSEELGANSRLTPINLAELKALMGGQDPLSIPRSEAGVTNVLFISGWGNDGRDEAILFIARKPDNSLKLHGWMVIKGGFSGARVGGTRLYTNQTPGFQVYVPKGYEVSARGNQVSIIAPGEGPGRGLGIIAFESAKGRTSDQVNAQVLKTAQAELGPGADLKSTSLKIENTQAFVITGLPGQDPNRQLFMVRGDQLYHMTFMPDGPRVGKAYGQMEDAYAMIVNTFHFTK